MIIPKIAVSSPSLLRACALLVSLAWLALPAQASAQTPEVRLTVYAPVELYPNTFGVPQTEVYINAELVLMNGVTLNAPTTLHFMLPEHTSYVGFDGSASAWQCSGSGRSVSCAYQNILSSSQFRTSYLALKLNVAGTLPVPGNSTTEATVTAAQLPPPDVANCFASSTYFGQTDNRCLRVLSQNLQPSVNILPDLWSPTGAFAVAEVGTPFQFRMGFSTVGYGFNNGPISVNVQLPPGFVYSSTAGNYGSWACSAGAVDSSGQRLTCTVPGAAAGTGPQTFQFSTWVIVTNSAAIPGPLPVFATISNAQQPAPDIYTCHQIPIPLGCGYYEVGTRPATQSRMDIIQMTRAPAQFSPGTYGVLTLRVANIGDAVAGTGDLKLSLPAGLAYTSVHASQIPSTVCSASGLPATGQTLSCSFAAGLPLGTSYDISLRLTADGTALSPARVVAAIGDAGSPGPSLVACSASPNAIGCGEHFISLSTLIFCNGFEVVGHICGLPQ